MFRVIRQYLQNVYKRRRIGLDDADIQHIRADLRFRLALVEYAYFGRSGRRVARALAELKSLLGDKAMHRYLRSLDPDLRTQFVERFQNQRRDAASRDTRTEADSQVVLQGKLVRNEHEEATAAEKPAAPQQMFASNVVHFETAARRSAQFDSEEEERDDTQPAESRE